MDVSGQLHAPADLNPEKELPVLIQYEAGGIPEPALSFALPKKKKNLTPDRPADKPSHCTHDCHIPALS
jgi:hypothetical protein